MKQIFDYASWVLVVTLWTTICFIVPDFMDNPTDGWYGQLLVAAYITACGIGSFFLLYIIGTNKYVGAFLLPIWSILGSVLSFYRIGFHTTFTPIILDVTLHTNIEEAMGVVSWQLVIWVVFNLLCVFLLLVWRWRKIGLTYSWIHAIIAMVAGTLYFTCNARLQNSLCQRFPYSVPTTIKAYVAMQQSIEQDRSTPPFTITEQPDSLTIVFIIGESARADHLQLNGYERETNPLLSKRSNIVSFPHIYSEQTHTLACMPYILTRADSTHEQYQYSERSFITLFRQNDYRTAWLSNQDLGNTFAHFPSESDTVVFANAGKTDFVYSPWMDKELLPIMYSIRKAAHHPRALFVLHTIGSHWYYNNHVPPCMYYFQPITTNRVITANSLEQIINSYDNSIRYMDYFVDKVIASLENSIALVVYQSDHGEALGEEGAYLHGIDMEEVKHPACIVWYSDAFAAAYPDKVNALIANRNKRYHTDYVFYSLLYAAGIEAEGDCATMNIFRQNDISEDTHSMGR
ncbi:MAG: sulfatase-like hydrolase/transferase [Paludibacteraceae bacterium]|nr:sulfatase-like hydrolase/transferase [Paludibacteraceae bacterium]